MRFSKPTIVTLVATVALSAVSLGRAIGLAQAPEPAKGVAFAKISETDAREWLTYLSSDLLQGRQVFTEGYGLAASYIAEHLREWKLKPLGDGGTYFQTVKRRGFHVVRNSTVTIESNGTKTTFKDGEHVTFPAAAGGKQTRTFDGIDFAGYGIVALNGSAGAVNDFAGRNVKDKLVVWLPGTPAGVAVSARTGNRSTYISQSLGAGAVIGFAPAPAAPSAEIVAADQAVADAEGALSRAQAARAALGGGRGGRGGGARGRGAAPATPADLTTVQNVEALRTPLVTGDETFFNALFATASKPFGELRASASDGKPLAPFALANIKVTIAIDNTYEVLTTELTKNVVGMVEGSDPQLRNTYVLFGAHLDHVGYRTSAAAGRAGRAGGGAAPAPTEPDLIYNGADDDGSGSTGLLGIAKAFATGPRPKRSVVLVWHAGEEAGLLGSEYMADFPVVPLDRVQAQLNIDMIGRNRNDDAGMANTVFVIGADRISTDLHNLIVTTNHALAAPLTLDFEYNDPSDPNTFYTRSDHYSYASKGIPIAFFFTGTHPDYHAASDHVEKILFPKLVRIAQMVYESGFSIANTDRVLRRDNLGPRSGRGFSGTIK